MGETLALLFGPKLLLNGSVDPRVILVDQGRTLQRADFPADWNLRIVHQDNFGGAGGFTRGMIEAMEEGAGWMLLMDDDATPDPASFPILADYIRDRAPDIRFALHGAMFSTEEPDTVYEAGAWIKRPRERHFDVVQRLRGYKPSEPTGRDPVLWEDMDIDYGAWWFFCVHSDSVGEIGLPLPLFIRGDDREFGLRLKTAGIPTIPLPGLRIWHSAQGVRDDAWPMFFDQRNKLIVHALYSESGYLVLGARMLYAGLRDIFSSRYDLARTSIAGILAFLDGPNALSVSPSALLRNVQEQARPDATGLNTGNSMSLSCMKSHRGRLIRLVIQLALFNGLLFPAKKTAGLPVARVGTFDWLSTFRIKAYGLAGADGSLRIYRRSFRRALHLISRLILVITRYCFTAKTLATVWRRSALCMSTPDDWRSRLGLEQKDRESHTLRAA